MPIFISLLFLSLFFAGCQGEKEAPIRVGILHSNSGTLALNEQPVANATLLALEELQAQGGLLGRPIEVVIGTVGSEPEDFAEEAQRLIAEEKVEVIFGCWSSASRKAVLPILERHRHLLFYPLQYEGLEQSPYVVYTGAVPNQQLIPAVKWALDNLGSRVFLVGSDYVYPRTAHLMARDQLGVLQAELVGEEYLLLGSADVAPIIEKIRQSKPDFILNTINGSSNFAFFQALKGAKITVPTMSMSLAESDFHEMGKNLPVGHYATWSYFQSVESPENRSFVRSYQKKFGPDSTLTDPMESAYFGVYLWAQAVRDAGSASPVSVKRKIGGQSLAAPGGIVSIDPVNHHTWKTVRVGQLNSQGQFDVKWSSAGPVRPRPFPVYRTMTQWESELNRLYEEWGGHWMNTAKP